MKMIDDVNEQGWTPTPGLATPFAEMLAFSPSPARSKGLLSTSAMSPFVDREQDEAEGSDVSQMLSEALAELHDEEFNESVAFLAEETEQYVSERFSGEAYNNSPDRERFAEAQLASVRFEAEQYLGALESGLSGMDLGSMTPESLDEVLDRFNPETGDLSPAGEEFIGGLIRKAKKAVKFVSKTAVKAANKIASPLIAPLLKKLRALVNPLLKRVLSFAIGRLPAPLRPAARQLADKIAGVAKQGESASDSLDEAPMSPANSIDMEMIAESFDTALAEAMIDDQPAEFEREAFDGRGDETVDESHELEMLGQARQSLVDQLHSAGDEEDIAPAIEQFVPAILSALRLGIKLVGRPKVVRFLAKYLGQLIGKWVGPAQESPLSNAIVNAGLQMVSLEAEDGGHGAPTAAGPAALASVVEDTIRRLSESEDYVFEDEGLMQLAAAEAFGQAVATHFPAQFVRTDLQQAPTLGGTFISQRPRSARSYAKYSVTPDVELTEQIADELPAFGGSTVGAAMRAAGAVFPVKARVHVYQAKAGSTVPSMVRADHRRGAGGTSHVHPLTPYAAGLLLREPRLGVSVPRAFVRSRHRVAAGQRLYRLEPIGPGHGQVPSRSRADAARLKPSHAWISVNRPKAKITVGFYIAEAEAQKAADGIKQGHGSAALLQLLVAAFKHIAHLRSGMPASPMISREDEGEDFEDFAARPANHVSHGFRHQLRRRIGAWVMPALANWVRANSEAFVRAVGHPDAGVTVRVHLSAVPGLSATGKSGSVPTGAASAAAIAALKGTPTISITVTPGKKRG